MIHEGLLHRMQLVAIRQPFDGADLLAIGLHGEHQAGAHRLAVDDDRAGAADAVLAADMGAGLPAILADGVSQCAPRLDADRVVAAVDGQGDGGLFAHAAFSALRKRRADALRRRRYFVDLHAERRERIVDRIHHRRRRADSAAFAQALGLGDRVYARRLDVMQFDRRDLMRGRRQVVGQRCGEDAAVVVVDDLLQQRVADALGDAAVHLAVGDHRIDDAAGILRHQEFLDLDVAGLHVDLDDGDVAGVGECAGRIVVAGLGQARLDFALEAMRLRVGLARQLSRSQSSGRCRRPWPRRPPARCRRAPPPA